MTGTRPSTPAPAPTDSPDPWVADHIRRFEETGGVPRPGIRDLLLTTRGRRSGVLRRTALAYVRDGEAAGGGEAADGGAAYVLTASNAGAERHPAWYLNLTADPAVTLQVGVAAFPATARPATPAEAERLWPVVVAAMPSYAAYRDAAARAGGREVPLVLVTRTAEAAEAPVAG
ncbi:nitroreductase family deazaflavin-dependent oxidoreductase [Streptomyces sp. ISL-43]|uniref:nitroreductase/quinone reductase family protein n=1 Tax=Streptomyces sp. ISL-43 TaxID=2819183 RepID=UPI001BE8BB08|nr:nitroreductase/quinone reductase family protein [Streptomyces sp. ISL-43]MBT2452468.1 nitroreductase family deazaflavin-dependent oxidoreductase [Streptomyces sp. ISL-43]